MPVTAVPATASGGTLFTPASRVVVDAAYCYRRRDVAYGLLVSVCWANREPASSAKRRNRSRWRLRGGATRVGTRNHILDGVLIGATCQIR